MRYITTVTKLPPAVQCMSLHSNGWVSYCPWATRSRRLWRFLLEPLPSETEVMGSTKICLTFSRWARNVQVLLGVTLLRHQAPPHLFLLTSLLQALLTIKYTPATLYHPDSLQHMFTFNGCSHVNINVIIYPIDPYYGVSYRTPWLSNLSLISYVYLLLICNLCISAPLHYYLFCIKNTIHSPYIITIVVIYEDLAVF